jgi:hypothetical protein
MLFPDCKVIHTGRLISYWTQYVIQHGVLPEHNPGKFVKKKSLIHVKDATGSVSAKPFIHLQVGLKV